MTCEEALLELGFKVIPNVALIIYEKNNMRVWIICDSVRKKYYRISHTKKDKNLICMSNFIEFETKKKLEQDIQEYLANY